MRRYPILALGACLTLAAGCPAPAMKAPLEPTPTKARTEASAKPPTSDGLPAPTVRASWVEPACEGCEPPSAFFSSKLEQRAAKRAIGVKVAVLATELGLFAHHRDRGVLGPLRAPIVKHLGIDASDEIYVVDETGSVHHAASADAASTGFTLRGQVQGAIAWDFVSGTVVAITESTVHVSVDGGSTFTTTKPPKGIGKLEHVLARADGVLVLEGHDLYVSRDRGKTWAPSRLGGGSPSRVGAHISICGVTLAVDGEHWVEGAHDDGHEVWPWFHVFELSREPAGLSLPKLWSALEPPPPPTPIKGVTGGIGCNGSILGPTGRRVKGVVMAAVAFSPYGLRRMAGEPLGPPPVTTRTTHGFVGDGACDPSSAEAHECKPGATWTRAPHVMRSEQGAFRLFSLPSSCQPVRIVDAMGAGLVACRAQGDEVTVAMLGANGFAGAEGASSVPLSSLDASSLGEATDGSLALVAKNGVSVRAPHELGTAGAWRTVSIAGALAHRVVTGGRLLTVVARSAESTRFDLVLDEPVTGRRIVGKDLEVRGGIADVGWSDGKIELKRHSLGGELEVVSISP